VILPLRNLTKLKLEYLKSGFVCKNERFESPDKYFASLEFDFFGVLLKFAFRKRP